MTTEENNVVHLKDRNLFSKSSPTTRQSSKSIRSPVAFRCMQYHSNSFTKHLFIGSLSKSAILNNVCCFQNRRAPDDPKAPGPVELEQNVPGTLTLCWMPSPDEKRDDRLSYVVAMKDSHKQTWRTVTENLFNHRCTVTVLPGREYYFRVFAKNDMGLSSPVESPSWVTKQEKGQ